MTTKIYFKGTKPEARELVAKLRNILVGREPDTLGVAKGFQATIGFAALTDIKESFITKSRGGTDEMGITWQPLSKRYLAYGRRLGPGEGPELKRASGLGRGHRLAPGQNKGLLTADQLKRWRTIFAYMTARFSLTMTMGEAKAKAAAVAWAKLKAEGAKTKLDVYGNRTVDILRDTGVLLNSLTPGQLQGTEYVKPSERGGNEQIFDLKPGSITVGTNVKYASTHQDGKGKVPQRQFLPRDGNQVPQPWWDRWLALGAAALEVGAEILFR